MSFTTKVMPGENGWPGTFIRGDDSLSLAHQMEMMADSVERGDFPMDILVDWLRASAVKFRACYVDHHPGPANHRLADQPPLGLG